MKKIISLSLATAILLNLTACGTILYPERKGQKGGRLDAGVVVLDGIGLLFFLIPGVIAFAVDFSNGTIYVPGSDRSSLDVDKMQPINVDKEGLTKELAAKIVSEKTGQTIDVSKAEIYKENKSGDAVRLY
ncbi:MAG: hypothetical protein PQ612_01300 [Rickettsiales bacterium]|nr:hypothetical protein [Pseudomonadota bacterium]MDA0965447.1 hypothetical protein [Pseudomonadota bacterium]MDG4542772.1 hypothetical protein [Rickettsiales bacterium]MDG4544780.1 hypothetical protein [Rickettsiales bacterium]MDG4546902.1 hypothetical protein [Rickettsiales bacterium]